MLPGHYTSYPDSVSPHQVLTDLVTFLVLLLDDSVSLIYHFNYFDERKTKIYVLAFFNKCKVLNSYILRYFKTPAFNRQLILIYNLTLF